MTPCDLPPCGCPACREPGEHPDLAWHRQLILVLSRLDEQQRRWVAALEAADHEAARGGEATREAAAPVEPTPGELVVETDGVVVRYRDG